MSLSKIFNPSHVLEMNETISRFVWNSSSWNLLCSSHVSTSWKSSATDASRQQKTSCLIMNKQKYFFENNKFSLYPEVCQGKMPDIRCSSVMFHWLLPLMSLIRSQALAFRWVNFLRKTVLALQPSEKYHTE